MPGLRFVLLVPLLAFSSGCTSMLGSTIGENFTGQGMIDPATGAHVYCQGHVGRGNTSKADQDRMNACIASYEAKGYRRAS
jgi:hypothetical protein